MAINRKQTVIHLHGSDGSIITGTTLNDIKLGEIVVEHASDGSARFGTKNYAEDAIVWFKDYKTTKKYIDDEIKTISDKVDKLEGLTGTTNSALQLIEQGENGSYVTTTISEKDADKKQKIGVAVTVQKVSDASETNKGLAEASDVKSYVDGVKTAIDGEISGITTDLETVKTKLDGVAEGAQVNTIEKIKKNGTELSISSEDKSVDITFDDTEVKYTGTHPLSGLTGTTVSAEIEGIEQAIFDNEKVTSASLNDLKTGLTEANKKIEDIPNSFTVTGVSADDKVLTLSDKVISSQISFSVDSVADESGNKYLRLKGKNDADLGKVNIADFVKDGMLSEAKLETNPEGKDEGTYIVLTWNTEAGKDPMYINVSSLIDTYTTGDNTLTLTDHAFKVNTEVIATKASVDELSKKTVNGQPISSGVTLTGENIEVGGDGTHKTDKLNTAVEDLYTKVDAASKAGVTSFGGQSGVITLKATSTDNGAVNFAMDGKTLSATVQGINTAAYKSKEHFEEDAAKKANAVLGSTGDTKDKATVYGVQAYVKEVETALNNKNVSATGDTYVSATADANKVTVAATEKLTEAVIKAESAVQSVSVKNTDDNKITATKSDDTKNVEFDFDHMVIDCGTF